MGSTASAGGAYTTAGAASATSTTGTCSSTAAAAAGTGQVDAAAAGAAAATVPVDSSIQVDVKLELLLDVEPWARSGMRYPQLVQKRAVARMGCPQFGQVSTIYPFTRSRGRVKLETQIEK